MSPTAGGFGLPKGSLDTTVNRAASNVAADGDGYDSVGNCAGYATSVGVGIYCYSGTGGVDPPPLIERFPDQRYHKCRYYDIPKGMKAPKQRPEPGTYYLRACIDNIDWQDPFGGEPKVTLSFAFVAEGNPDPTEWDPTPLDEFLWDQVRSNYPVPFATPWPIKIPRVNAPTWFEFRWLDENLETAAHGPYAGNENGGPYLELSSSGVELIAQASDIRIEPQVIDPETGSLMEPVHCPVPPLSYNQNAEPTKQAQQNPCNVTFEHSSAAAAELTPTGVPLPEPDPDYPIPMYVVNIEVDWHVTMTSGDTQVDLGTHTFTAYQQLPVAEVSGLVGPDV